MNAFSAWKAHDADTLLRTMLAQYVELDRIWQTVKNEGEEAVEAEYRDGIRENQILLLARIKRLAGPDKAKLLIRDAVRQARRGQRSGKNRGRAGEDARGRAAAAAAAAAASPSSSSVAADLAVDQHMPSSMPAESTAPESVPSAPTAVPSAPPAPTDPLAFEEILRGIPVIPDNRTLIHELAINKDYRIDVDKMAVTGTDPRRHVHHSVFDEMRADLDRGQGERWIVVMTVHIRSRLLRLLTPGNSLHVLISEALDPDVVARECAMGNFSYERFFDFMMTILPRLCAPFRDPDVAALAQHRGGNGNGGDDHDDVIDRLERLVHVIDLLSLDFANFLLRESAPQLLSEAPAYEARCFGDDLAKGNVTLRRTERWWVEARDKVFAEASRRDPEAVNHPGNRPSARRIYFQGLTDLFVAVAPLDPDLVPETLRLDHDRIAAARADTLRIVTVAAILLSAKNLLKRDVRSPWKTEASRVWEILKDGGGGGGGGGGGDGGRADHTTTTTTTTNPQTPLAPAIQSVLESAHNLPPAVKAHVGTLINRFVSQAQSRTLTDPVMRLLFHRLRTHVLSRLMMSSSSSPSAFSSAAVAATSSNVHHHHHHQQHQPSSSSPANTNLFASPSARSGTSTLPAPPASSSSSSGSSSSSSVTGNINSTTVEGFGAGTAPGRIAGTAPAANGNDRLVASGMCEFVGRIAELADDVRRVGDVDRAAHAPWYDDMAARGGAVAGGGSRGSGGSG